MMSVFRVTVTALVLCLAAESAMAAELTDVADAVDIEEIGTIRREDPFDFNLALDFQQIRESGKITREPFDRPGISSTCTEATPIGCVPVDELDYRRNTTLMRLKAEFGLFQDLSFSVGWSYVLEQNLTFDYAEGVDATNSSIDPQTGNPDDTLFANDFQAAHNGSGPLEFGLKWSPLNDFRDVTKPTWLLFFNWSSPWTTSVFDP
ncbi:MAG: hypothetical protein AAF658_19645, partial [Myxococcota bacterium]